MPKNVISAEHLESLETKEPSPIAETISIPRLDIRTIDVKIVGDSSLATFLYMSAANLRSLAARLRGVALLLEAELFTLRAEALEAEAARMEAAS